MEKIRAHSHTNVSKIKSYCRNRRQENTTGISDHNKKFTN